MDFLFVQFSLFKGLAVSINSITQKLYFHCTVYLTALFRIKLTVVNI